jgi:hypothetical protein
MFNKARDKEVVQVSSELSEENSQRCFDDGIFVPIVHNSKSTKNRKSQPRLPFPTMVGPKGLRLVRAINDGAILFRRRKEGISPCSSSSSEEQVSPLGGEEQSGKEASKEGVHRTNSPGLNLEVVLPVVNSNPGQSGVHVLMGEHSMLNDDGGKILEAKHLIEIQKDL